MLINLHTHLEGRLRPETAVELAPDVGLDGSIDWRSALQLSGPSNLTTFLAKVFASYPFFSSRENLARITCEAVEDAAADGTDYFEFRFGPATHVRDGLDLDAVVRSVCEGAAEGTRRSGLAAGVVVAALRHHDRDTNRLVAEVAARHAGAGIVGFDLAGDELRFPGLEPHVEAFAIAKAAGLGLTCHAAEAAPAAAAKTAVELLGVSRIGHGAHLADDPALMTWAADNGVVIEVCPTSNWYTGAITERRHHPVRRFMDAGMAIVLGDDNPVQTQSSLSQERAELVATYALTPAELQTLDATSVAAAFVEESTRNALARRLTPTV